MVIKCITIKVILINVIIRCPMKFKILEVEVEVILQRF